MADTKANDGTGNLNEGAGDYGTIHVQLEEMRAAQTGVFEPKSGEVGRKKAKAPANKAEPAPTNKAAASAKAK